VEDASKSTVQENLERTAQLSEMLFGAPSGPASYVIVAASSLAGLLLLPGVEGLAAGFVLVALPGFAAGLLSAPLASALGGTFYHRRAAFMAAVGCALVSAAVSGATLLGAFIPVNPVHGLLLGYALLLALRHSVLYAMCDIRHRRTLPVTLLPYLVAVVGLALLVPHLRLGARELFLMTALPFIYIGGSIFFLRMFDAPVRKNFGVSAFDLFRYFLDHFTAGSPTAERILEQFSEPIQAKVGVVAFRRPGGAVKACIVVPALHPGPVGELGGGDLPGKIAERVGRAEHVLVPHGPATHDFNPSTTAEVERVGKAVNEALTRMTWETGGSQLAGAPRGVRVWSQLFGHGALLTYTSWPEPIDDVSYGVGHAAELSARIAGAQEAIFVDCHNSLTPGAGAVFPCTPRADRIAELAHEATLQAEGLRVPEVRVGVAQVGGFQRVEGIGKQGVQVVAVQAGAQKVAYVLWDGNNMLPEVTEHVGRALEGLVDRYQVMTTDNHSVNLVAGGFNPVGHRLGAPRIADATRAAVEKALGDLEVVECGVARLTISGLRVFGHDKTARLTASVNVMTSMAGQVLLAWAMVVGMATAIVLIASRALA
jgi:putative membrane protein